MPTIEQLDKTTALLFGEQIGFYDLANDEDKVKVMELTIAAIQAKALADIAYMYGVKG